MRCPYSQAGAAQGLELAKEPLAHPHAQAARSPGVMLAHTDQANDSIGTGGPICGDFIPQAQLPALP